MAVFRIFKGPNI